MNLDELEKICDAATQGEWIAEDYQVTISDEFKHRPLVTCHYGNERVNNALYIATFSPQRVKHMIGLLCKAAYLVRPMSDAKVSDVVHWLEDFEQFERGAE